MDAADYVVWRKTQGQAVTYFSCADGDGSGMIDAGDYNVWRANFGATAGSGAGLAGIVPEPVAGWLLFSGMSILATLFRRGRSGFQL